MKIQKWALCFGVFSTFLLSCNKEEPPPAYLYIEPYTLLENPNVEAGGLSQRITNVLLNIDGKRIGTFNLPALVPLPGGSGNVDVELDAFVRYNGSKYSVELYPFYQRFSTSVLLTPLEYDTIRPETIYKNETRIVFLEDFDTNAIRLSDDYDNDPETKLELSTTGETGLGGIIRLTKDHPLAEMGTSITRPIDIQRTSVIWMEVSFRGTLDFAIGLQGTKNQVPVPANYEYLLPAKAEWTKVYFDMTDLVINMNLDEHQLALVALIPTANGAFSQDEGFIEIDNLKIIQF